MNRDLFYRGLAKVMRTSVADVFTETDETDAGASFKNGYNVQISPYSYAKYTLWKETDETFSVVLETRTMADMINKAFRLGSWKGLKVTYKVMTTGIRSGREIFYHVTEDHDDKVTMCPMSRADFPVPAPIVESKSELNIRR